MFQLDNKQPFIDTSYIDITKLAEKNEMDSNSAVSFPNNIPVSPFRIPHGFTSFDIEKQRQLMYFANSDDFVWMEELDKELRDEVVKIHHVYHPVNDQILKNRGKTIPTVAIIMLKSNSYTFMTLLNAIYKFNFTTTLKPYEKYADLIKSLYITKATFENSDPVTQASVDKENSEEENIQHFIKANSDTFDLLQLLLMGIATCEQLKLITGFQRAHLIIEQLVSDKEILNNSDLLKVAFRKTPLSHHDATLMDHQFIYSVNYKLPS